MPPGTPPLDDATTRPLLGEVPGWGLRGRGRASRRASRSSFEFADFLAAMAFVDKLAALAEDEAHHPDFCVHYNQVDVTLWTHSVGGLSENDFILAAKLDATAGWAETGGLPAARRHRGRHGSRRDPALGRLRCARDGIKVVGARARHRARRRAVARGDAAPVGRDEGAAPRGGVRRGRRGRQPDRRTRVAAGAGPRRARSGCATAAWSATRALVDALRGLPRKPAPARLGLGDGLLRRPRRPDPHRDLRGGEGVPRRAGARLGGRGEQGRRGSACGVVLLRNGRRAVASTAASCASSCPRSGWGWAGGSAAGTQWLPWIHIDDEIGLIRHVIAHEGGRGRP